MGNWGSEARDPTLPGARGLECQCLGGVAVSIFQVLGVTGRGHEMEVPSSLCGEGPGAIGLHGIPRISSQEGWEAWWESLRTAPV